MSIWFDYSGRFIGWWGLPGKVSKGLLCSVYFRFAVHLSIALHGQSGGLVKEHLSEEQSPNGDGRTNASVENEDIIFVNVCNK